MPKNDMLRRIDETLESNLIIDRDTYDPNQDTTPSVPEGVSVKSVQDGILITVDFNLDAGHLHPRFQAFIVYVRSVNEIPDDDSGIEVGRFSDSDWVWQQDAGGYTGWEIALAAVSNTGYESAKTSWYRCYLSTYHDDFSIYGGDLASNLESLYWLKISDFDTDEGWAEYFYGTVSSETINYKEGDRALRVNMEENVLGGGWLAHIFLNVTLDLSTEGRFSDDDYVILPVYVSNESADTTISVYFLTDISNSYGKQFTASDITAGAWNYFSAKKADFSATGSPNWNNITRLDIRYDDDVGTTNWYMIVDDLRIVKADPDDADTYNDTGYAWDFNGGEWHIYHGNRTGEPDCAFSLGQIENTAGEDYFATIPISSIPNGHISAGVQFKDVDGRAGVVFRIEDSTFGSETLLAVEVDVSSDKIYLVRFTDGTRTVLASVDMAIGSGETVWLGADFRDLQNEGRILVYYSRQEQHLWEGNTLVISHSTSVPWPAGYQVGLMAGYRNVRFVNFRAGSPQTADYAHKAGYAISAGYTIESPAALASFLALPGLVGYWPMSSVQRNTGNVYDLSGQGRTLTYNGNPTFNIYNDLVAYLDLDNINDYLYRADETDLDVLGTEPIYDSGVRGLTLGGWFWQDAWGAGTILIAKDDAVSNRSFALRSDDLYPNLLVNGTTQVVNTIRINTGTWFFCAGRYKPSTELKVWKNSSTTINTTSIPAALNSTAAVFTIGAYAGGGNPLNGRVSHCFLCAIALTDMMVNGLFQQTRGLFGV